MDQSQIETIIRERIQELRQLEKSAASRSVKVSYEDKADELEVILLRIRGLSLIKAALA